MPLFLPFFRNIDPGRSYRRITASSARRLAPRCSASDDELVNLIAKVAITHKMAISFDHGRTGAKQAHSAEPGKDGEGIARRGHDASAAPVGDIEPRPGLPGERLPADG